MKRRQNIQSVPHWVQYSLGAAGPNHDPNRRGQKTVSDFYLEVLQKSRVKRKRVKGRLDLRLMVIGVPEFATNFESAPPWVERGLRSSGVLDDIRRKGRKSISDFYFYVSNQLMWVAEFDGATTDSMSWRPLAPAMRERLRSIRQRLSAFTDIAISGGYEGSSLLLDAQSSLEKFGRQLPRRSAKRLTGGEYLRDWGWFARPPTVAFAFFVLLRSYSNPPLTKSQAYKRIRYLLAVLCKLNLEIDSVKRMIRRFLGVIEKLPPPFTRTE
jgi:hypothetical protein